MAKHEGEEMMRTKSVVQVFPALLLLGVAACEGNREGEADSDSDAPVPVAEEQVLAETSVPGGKARFFSIESDTLLIETELAQGSPPVLLDPAVRGLNAVELYERWSGKRAPEELVALARRVALAERAAEAAPAEREGDERISTITQALPGPEFVAVACPDMQFCWTDKTGTWEHEERSRYWLGRINAVIGDVTVSMRRREVFGGWTQVWTRPVYSGSIKEYGASSDTLNKRPLKFKIYEADGDTWHLAAKWW